MHFTIFRLHYCSSDGIRAEDNARFELMVECVVEMDLVVVLNVMLNVLKACFFLISNRSAFDAPESATALILCAVVGSSTDVVDRL